MVEICLGTAQWGKDYGLTNSSGRLSDSDLTAIINVARQAGITRIDTAAGYGDAHLRVKPWTQTFTITTKVAGSNAEDVLARVDGSLAELGVPVVENLLIHDWDDLGPAERSRVVICLEEVLAGGRVRNVGISVYGEPGLISAAELFADQNVPIGVIQVPANALDRRLDGSTVLRRLADGGTWVQVRSVFLQGLLAERSGTELGIHPDIVKFHGFAQQSGRSPVEVALNHVRALSWVNELILGLATAEQFAEVLHYWTTTSENLAPSHLQSKDVNLIDPRQWS